MPVSTPSELRGLPPLSRTVRRALAWRTVIAEVATWAALLGTGSQGHIVLKAAPNAAPIENVPISVLAHVSINFVVKIAYASEPILVTVEPK